MPEWIVDLWLNNREALLVTVIGGAILTLINVAISRRATPNTFRQRKSFRDRKARLEAKLEQHLDDQETPGRTTTLVIWLLMLQAILWFSYLALLTALYLIDRELVSFFPPSLRKPVPPSAIVFNLLFVFGNALFYLVPAALRLYRLLRPTARTEYLEKRIRQLEEDEALIP